MSEFRENLLTRIINIYGFEHEITLLIAHLMETYEENEFNDRMLEILVECHEAEPVIDED